MPWVKGNELVTATNLKNAAYCWAPGCKALQKQPLQPQKPNLPPSKRRCSGESCWLSWRCGWSWGRRSSALTADPWSPTQTCRGSPAWSAGSFLRLWAWPPAVIKQQSALSITARELENFVCFKWNDDLHYRLWKKLEVMFISIKQ